MLTSHAMPLWFAASGAGVFFVGAFLTERPAPYALRKIGGIYFLRFFRLRVSICIAKAG